METKTRKARVNWESLKTKATGHGDWISVENARAWVDFLNDENRNKPMNEVKLRHWVEYQAECPDERTQHILEERKKETFKRIAHEIDLDGWSAAIDPDGKECNTAIPRRASIGRTSRTDEQTKKGGREDENQNAKKPA